MQNQQKCHLFQPIFFGSVAVHQLSTAKISPPQPYFALSNRHREFTEINFQPSRSSRKTTLPTVQDVPESRVFKTTHVHLLHIWRASSRRTQLTRGAPTSNKFRENEDFSRRLTQSPNWSPRALGMHHAPRTPRNERDARSPCRLSCCLEHYNRRRFHRMKRTNGPVVSQLTAQPDRIYAEREYQLSSSTSPCWAEASLQHSTTLVWVVFAGVVVIAIVSRLHTQ